MEFIKHWMNVLGAAILIGGIIAAFMGVVFLITNLFVEGHIILGIVVIALLISLLIAAITYDDRNSCDAQFV